MAFCTQCGTRLPDQARFCPRCGAPAPTLDPAGDNAAGSPGYPAPDYQKPERADKPAGDPPRQPRPDRPRDASGGTAADLPAEGLHFGPAAFAPASPPATPRPAPARIRPIDADSDADDDSGDDDGSDGDDTGSTGTRLLVILALVAVAVLAVVFWQQRDGTRPVAETAGNAATAAAEPDPEPTALADIAPPAPEPTPTPTPTLEVAPTGDEFGSTASLDPNGEAAIPAAAIDTAFDDDADRAAEEFPGPVTVRGTVVGLLSDSPPTLSLEGRSRGSYVIADLAGAQRDALQLVGRGSVVRLRCGAVRHESGTTVLYGCRL